MNVLRDYLKKVLALTIIFLFFSIMQLHAQRSYTLSGFVTDAENGEALIGTNVYLQSQTIGTITNQYGFYSLTMPAGAYSIIFNDVGYAEKDTSIDLQRDLRLDMELQSTTLSTEEIVVTAQTGDDNIKAPEMGVVTVSPREIKQIPILFGEQDVLKTIQLLPGVTSGSEGSSGFHVRGGGLDQNLILLDEAPVYNPAHLMGFFSVFNSDVINSAKLIKGGGPPQYGGRLSSVFDIKMKEGNSKQFGITGGIGLISSRLAIEGPLNGGKGSFLLAGRRTYADLVMKTADSDNFKDVRLYFYDLNLKANYNVSDDDHLYLSAYLGRDVMGYKNQFGLDWGNITATLRWNHLFSNRLFSNTSLIYSNFDYVVSFENSGSLTDITSGIEDFNLKQNFYFLQNPSSKFLAGLDFNYHTFMPGQISTSGQATLNNFKIAKKHALEWALYLGHEWKLSPRYTAEYGLRYSVFNVIGPGTVYDYDVDGNPASITEYPAGKLIMTYQGIEPRFTVNALVDRSSSIKLSYARTRQYIHLISNSSGGPSLDVWHPSTSIVQPGIADQVAAGYFRNFADNSWEGSVELYYKDLQNQIDYKNGADLILNPYVESQLVFGRGKAYGLEFFLRRNTGKFTGWIGYTLSRSERNFKDINSGRIYPTIHDRTHDISVVGMYQFSPKWSFSANWIYYTGIAATYPSGKYFIDGQTVNYYTERNGYRLPSYHRLDLSATYHLDRHGRYESNLNFSLYNAYGHKNPYTIYFREKENNPAQTEAVMIYLFTYFPSISYNFKW